MKRIVQLLKASIGGALTRRTEVVQRPDRPLMMRYGALKLKCTGGAFVEIGAGVGGNASGFFDAHGLDRARGHLIEACPRNFEILRTKAAGFRAYNFAVASADGEVTLNVLDRADWEGSSPSNSTDLDYVRLKYPDAVLRQVTVPAKRLDRFLDEADVERVGFAIFNCEGSEYEIFSGDLSFLRRLDSFYLDLHGRITLTPEAAEKKRDILARIRNEGFALIGGSLPSDVERSNGHLSFLFERDR